MKQLTIISRTPGQLVRGTLALTVALILSACAGGDGEENLDNEAQPEAAASVEEPLFDTATMDQTAKQAMFAAGAATLASPIDPLNPFFGRQVEYCGLVIKKSNSTFRASAPVTSYLEQFCRVISTPLSQGETVVGYYHTHTPASVAKLSDADKTTARTPPKRVYYVISTVNGCAEKYNPATNVTTPLGCFPTSF